MRASSLAPWIAITLCLAVRAEEVQIDFRFDAPPAVSRTIRAVRSIVDEKRTADFPRAVRLLRDLQRRIPGLSPDAVRVQVEEGAEWTDGRSHLTTWVSDQLLILEAHTRFALARAAWRGCGDAKAATALLRFLLDDPRFKAGGPFLASVKSALGIIERGERGPIAEGGDELITTVDGRRAPRRETQQLQDEHGAPPRYLSYRDPAALRRARVNPGDAEPDGPTLLDRLEGAKPGAAESVQTR